MSMTAPQTYIETAPQHWFSKSTWSQHSETAFKVHLPFQVIKLPKSSPWPTDYKLLNKSFAFPSVDLNRCLHVQVSLK